VFRRSAALGVVALALLACEPDSEPLLDVSGAIPASALAASGCWKFTRPTAFIRDLELDSSVLQLDTAISNRGHAMILRVVPPTIRQAQLSRLSGWGVEARDSSTMVIWLGNGFSGVSMEMKQRGAELVGYGRQFTDFGPPWRIPRNALAQRVPCPR
jgi:hypothetical protein